MATGRKKMRRVVFGAVRFFKGSSRRTSEESRSSASTSDAASVSIPMTSLESLSTTSSMSQSSSAAVEDISWSSAVLTNDQTAVNDLLSRGADINAAVSSDGWTALHIAAWNGWIDLVQLLIASGCDLDSAGPGCVSPLALACQRGHTVVVQSLVCAGCDVNRRACYRMSKSFSAASHSNGDVKCRHVTAVHLAARYGHIGALRCLVSAGAMIDAAMTVADRVGGVTPLHLAVEAGHIDVIDYLIAAGSDVNNCTRTHVSSSTHSGCDASRVVAVDTAAVAVTNATSKAASQLT